MNIPKFFRLPNHYIFDYKPMYYDPEKEKREKREKTIKSELKIEDKNEEYKANIKGQFKYRMSYKKHSRKASTIRLLIIIAFLGLITYFLFYSNIIDNLFKYF